MEFDAFTWIQDGLWEELEKQGFRAPQPLEDQAGKAVSFSTDEVAYSLLYDEKHQRFQLRSTTLTEEGQPTEWRGLSLWLFDPAEGTKGDADSILNDFLEVVRGPKRVAMVQQKKTRRTKDNERSVDPLFFLNRLVNFFPELKEEINEEKIVYGQVRAVTFVRSQVVPKVSRLLKSSSKTATLEKLGSLLGDMYKDGDLDLRSVVTIALLNQLDDQDFETLKPHLGEELQKAVRFTRKLKGKKVKPEKKKKEKKVVARLDDKH